MSAQRSVPTAGGSEAAASNRSVNAAPAVMDSSNANASAAAVGSPRSVAARRAAARSFAICSQSAQYAGGGGFEGVECFEDGRPQWWGSEWRAGAVRLDQAVEVALAWVRSSGVLPLVGARTPEQVTDCLGEVVLPPEAVARLEASAPFEWGFPADFIAQCEASPFAFGEAVVS